MMEFLTWLQGAMADAAFAKGMLIGFFGLLVAAIWITHLISSNAREAKIAGYNASLKSQMIDRGMSPEEIERVIAAAPANSDDDEDEAVPQNAEARLLKDLTDNDYDSSDVRQILVEVRKLIDGPTPADVKEREIELVRQMVKSWMDADDILAALRDKNAALRSAPASTPENAPV